MAVGVIAAAILPVVIGRCVAVPVTLALQAARVALLLQPVGDVALERSVTGAVQAVLARQSG